MGSIELCREAREVQRKFQRRLGPAGRVELAIALALCAVAPGARADEEAANRAYVRASEWGSLYAKSVPSAAYGTEGHTQIYRVVADGPDDLVYRYEWYAPELFLEGFPATNDVYVAQLGPWPRGHEARAEHPAIAFFKNGKRLKSYSTLEIAGAPANVSASVSHYQIFGKRLGFRRPFGNQLMFDIEDAKGATLSFDAETGFAPDCARGRGHAPARRGAHCVPAAPLAVVRAAPVVQGRRRQTSDLRGRAARALVASVPGPSRRLPIPDRCRLGTR